MSKITEYQAEPPCSDCIPDSGGFLPDGLPCARHREAYIPQDPRYWKTNP